jgi:predicted AAA+ superfamily ATPase
MSISEIRNLNAFSQLYRILAIQSAAILNKNNLARDIKLSLPTLNTYLEILTQIYQITWLPSWATNLGKRLVKSSKMFFSDSGMMSHLLNIFDESNFDASYLNGNVVETFVFSELFKSVKSQILPERFSFFRTEDGKEVDFIIEGAGRPIAIEVKSSEHARIDDFKHIKYLQKTKPKLDFQGIVFYMGNETVVLDENCTAVPIAALF